MATSGVYPIWGIAAVDTIATVRGSFGAAAALVALTLAGCGGETASHESVVMKATEAGLQADEHQAKVAARKAAPCLRAEDAMFAWAATTKAMGKRYTHASAWVPFVEKALAFEVALKAIPGTEQAIAAVSRQREAAAALEADDVGYESDSLASIEESREGINALLAAEEAYPSKGILRLIRAGC